jgi:drug/metabolite transporter (DMT)-like permease
MTSTHALPLRAKPAARPAVDARWLGVLFVLGAVACFSGLDTSSKAIGAMPVMMLVWFRYVTQASVTALTQWPRRGRALLETRHPWLHALRGLLILSTSVCTNLALRAMPVGELTAIVMLTPLLMTLIGATFLHERVSPARWSLIVTAFAGALLVAKPGAGMWSWGLLMALLALALNTGFHLVTSRLSRTEDVGTMQFHTGCTGALLATLALPFFWTPVGFVDHLGAAGAGVRAQHRRPLDADRRLREGRHRRAHAAAVRADRLQHAAGMAGLRACARRAGAGGHRDHHVGRRGVHVAVGARARAGARPGRARRRVDGALRSVVIDASMPPRATRTASSRSRARRSA